MFYPDGCVVFLSSYFIPIETCRLLEYYQEYDLVEGIKLTEDESAVPDGKVLIFDPVTRTRLCTPAPRLFVPETGLPGDYHEHESEEQLPKGATIAIATAVDYHRSHFSRSWSLSLPPHCNET